MKVYSQVSIAVLSVREYFTRTAFRHFQSGYRHQLHQLGRCSVVLSLLRADSITENRLVINLTSLEPQDGGRRSVSSAGGPDGGNN